MDRLDGVLEKRADKATGLNRHVASAKKSPDTHGANAGAGRFKDALRLLDSQSAGVDVG